MPKDTSENVSCPNCLGKKTNKVSMKTNYCMSCRV